MSSNRENASARLPAALAVGYAGAPGSQSRRHGRPRRFRPSAGRGAADSVPFASRAAFALMPAVWAAATRSTSFPLLVWDVPRFSLTDDEQRRCSTWAR